MPRPTLPSRLDIARSLKLKVALYVQSSAKEGRGASPVEGLDAYANELADRRQMGALRAIAGEIDTWLRELSSPPSALLLVARMRRAGVLEQHLPVLPSARRLRAVALRGNIKSRADAQLVQSTLMNPDLAHLLGPNAQVLGAALDRWQTKLN